jgi:hypothetical protein
MDDEKFALVRFEMASHLCLSSNLEIPAILLGWTLVISTWPAIGSLKRCFKATYVHLEGRVRFYLKFCACDLTGFTSSELVKFFGIDSCLIQLRSVTSLLKDFTKLPKID